MEGFQNGEVSYVARVQDSQSSRPGFVTRGRFCDANPLMLTIGDSAPAPTLDPKVRGKLADLLDPRDQS